MLIKFISRSVRLEQVNDTASLDRENGKSLCFGRTHICTQVVQIDGVVLQFTNNRCSKSEVDFGEGL